MACHLIQLTVTFIHIHFLTLRISCPQHFLIKNFTLFYGAGSFKSPWISPLYFRSLLYSMGRRILRKICTQIFVYIWQPVRYIYYKPLTHSHDATFCETFMRGGKTRIATFTSHAAQLFDIAMGFTNTRYMWNFSHSVCWSNVCIDNKLCI
jgi:hypothetical protein